MHELKKCQTCGNTFPSTLSFCLNDGNPLVEIDSLIGTILDGRYRLDGLIGEGGMGDVYRATHVRLETEFAVKLLKPEFVANQTAIKRFGLEAKAAGRIHHPNAIRVTDFGVTPERIVFLVMELVHGDSLRKMLREEGALDYIRTVNIVRQICGAVEAAHRSGVIHRDLKPDNIIIEKSHHQERVKVLDFGIAKLKETKPSGFLTQAGMIIGTPQYMSPEQCQSKPLDPTSDIYSIGIILYEMLSGLVPFDADSTLDVVFKQLHDTPRPLQEVAPRTPDVLAQVVMRSLLKNPEHRQQSASELSDELKIAVETLGEKSSLAATDALVYRPVTAPGIDAETVMDQPALLTDPQQDIPTSAGRKTSVLSRRSSEEELAAAKGTAGGVVSAESRVPTPQTKILPDSDSLPNKGARPGWVIPAAVVVIALLGGLLYYLLQSEPKKPGPGPGPVTTVIPEGMVKIAGGKFIMGRNDGSPDEGPAHEVEVQGFFLDETEVTNQSYKAFIDATSRRAPKNWKFNGSYEPGEGRYPVSYVTWEDAAAYAKWAGKRLPTEAEWEYVARGGKEQRLYTWGNEWQAGYANVDRKDVAKPATVRSFEKDASIYGVYDLNGNVSEWVQDNYTETYGARPDSRFRVYRGGNFLDGPDKATNTYRWSDFPTDIPDDQILRVGFRCAKDAPPAAAK